jgi:DNA-directed RNA polymerase subunit D
MELIDKKENQIIFSLDIEEGLANAIRRYISEIPTLAIDEVEIVKNDSPLYDETIAHRLGLIPLKNEKVGEKGVKLKLSSSKEGIVYSKELKGNADVVYGNIPITSLNDGQEIELVATANLGKGSEHSKFLPGLIFYRDASEIIMDKSLLEKIKKVCDEKQIKDKGDKIVINDNGKTEIRDICEGICEKAGKKCEIKPLNELILTVESFGQISVKDIFVKSIETLKKDLNDVAKKVSK